MGLFTYFSLCLLGILVANPFLGAEADTCAREWLQNQGNCYAYFDAKLTWQEAEYKNSDYDKLISFKQWNDAACRKLNAYICKHEL
nr:C-type lectin-like [Zootoca vivipara]